MDERVPVYLASAVNAAEALRDAYRAWNRDRTLDPKHPVVIAAADPRTARRGGLAEVVQACLPHPPGDVSIVEPIPLARLTWQRLRRGRDLSTSVALEGGELPSIGLLDAIASARTLIAVNDLRGETATRPVIALGIWSRFTGLRDRIGAGLSAADPGVAAEIALAVRPALIVISDRWKNRDLVVVTSDQIAAELITIALRHLNQPDLDEPVGPWEDPLVQRATERHLGVLLPSQIALRVVARRSTERDDEAWLRSLADAIALRIGVEDVGFVADPS